MKNRRSKRHDSELFAEVYSRPAHVTAAGAENISDEGVCLNLSNELPEGELVGVSMFRVDDGIEDPDIEPINVPAKVVWCDKKPGHRIQAGMRFVDPKDH